MSVDSHRKNISMKTNVLDSKLQNLIYVTHHRMGATVYISVFVNQENCATSACIRRNAY